MNEDGSSAPFRLRRVQISTRSERRSSTCTVPVPPAVTRTTGTPARISDDARHIELPDGERIQASGNGIAGAGGRDVTVGIRPEHLVDTSNGEGDGVVHLTVDLVEQLGADTLVHGHFGNDHTDLTVRLRGIRNLNQGETIPLSVTPNHLHLFEPESGNRLDATDG